MGLREEAAADCREIHEDEDDFGWPLQLTNPAGVVSSQLIGLSTDIGFMIDLDTGASVSGRRASISFSIASFLSSGVGSDLPEGIADESLKPWLVTLNDLRGNPHTFKISSTEPDRGIDLIVCHLEIYGDN